LAANQRSAPCSAEFRFIPAVTFLTMIPAVVLFVFAQKSFVKGITFTGVKG
jgi:multiple sugar transport system permease protein